MDNSDFYSKNMHYAFNKEYQEKIISLLYSNPIKKNNDEEKNIINSFNSNLLRVINDKKNEILSHGRSTIHQLEMSNKNLSTMYFTVLYPGMIIRTGYSHYVPNTKGGIRMGFQFDYVTGEPYYPGSSVKGVIRFPFEMASKKDNSCEYRKYLCDLFGVDFDPDVHSPEYFESIKKYIFGYRDSGEGVDSFFDSWFVDSLIDNSPLIGLDSITPHIDGPLKNPSPLTMIKIMPGSCIGIPILYGSDIEGNDTLDKLNVKQFKQEMSQQKRMELYKQILVDFGLGSKTNVGYGNIIEFSLKDVKQDADSYKDTYR